MVLLFVLNLAQTSDGGEEPPSAIEKPTLEKAATPPTYSPSQPASEKDSTNGVFYRIDAHRSAYYEKPNGYSFLTHTPLNIVDWLKESFQQKNALTIAAIAVATGGLIAADQEIYRAARNTGRSLHITDDDKMRGRIPVVSGLAIQYPTNLGSALYFLGDGVVPISITGGLLGYGLAASDVRSLQTASQMAEGMLSVAIVVQVLKRSTGRQVPRLATTPGGKWHFFPDFNDYNKHTPTYDAFPSGHIATTMMTITVLSENYPEYTLIKPIGYGVMTLLGFQMINNGVHWASDYPLAIAIGYGLGKVVVSKGRNVVSAEDIPEKTTKRPLFTNMAMIPMPIENGGALFVVGTF